MPSPRDSFHVPDADECGGVTQLRVYGVGGTMRAVIDSDLPPELASGSRIGGIYRISPHRAGSEEQDQDQDQDADRTSPAGKMTSTVRNSHDYSTSPLRGHRRTD
jgi:hypothetical protein